MKRSEMVKKLQQSFLTHMNCTCCQNDEQLYSTVLQELENAGMLPPPLQGVVNVEEHENELVIPVWSWETEEEVGTQMSSEKNIVCVGDDKTAKLVSDTIEELENARAAYPPFNSPHEGYAVLLEETNELWDLVKVKQSKHDLAHMRLECIQIAAMALRFALDLTENSNTKTKEA